MVSAMISNLFYAPLRRYGVWRKIGKGIFAAALAVLPVAGAQAEALRIAALGDSLTQGYGLPADQGLVPQLQGWLDARGHDVIVINAGVSGDTTAGGLSRLDWTLSDGVDAIIVALGGNDLLRGIPPAASRANLEAIMTRAQSDGLPVLLVGLPAPANFGPDFQRDFDAIYPDLAARFDALLVSDFFAPLTRAAQADAQGALSAYMQEDGIHPNAAGVALIVDDLGPQVEALIAKAAP